MNDQPKRPPRKGGHRAGLAHIGTDTTDTPDADDAAADIADDTDTDDIEDTTVSTGCRANTTTFVAAESVLSKIIQLGKTLEDLDTDDAELVSTAMGWCGPCTIRNGCYRRMTKYGYTGLAGGRLIYRGNPYTPRKGRGEDSSDTGK
ncbi:MAG: hypothetical protein AB7G47_20225 [Mycolicibacterium sp.]|uniref:hypothetical protein n=1 Tax=Mycolicibacterium sp. TaxID=2320850 RepID=UPI003D0BF357